VSNWEKVAAFSFGAVFLGALLVIAVAIPEPTASQYVTLKTLLAISAAGVGTVIPGVLGLKLPLGRKGLLRAAGATVFFVLVFFFSPSPPVRETIPAPNTTQNVGAGGEGVQVVGNANTVEETH